LFIELFYSTAVYLIEGLLIGKAKCANQRMEGFWGGLFMRKSRVAVSRMSSAEMTPLRLRSKTLRGRWGTWRRRRVRSPWEYSVCSWRGTCPSCSARGPAASARPRYRRGPSSVCVYSKLRCQLLDAFPRKHPSILYAVRPLESVIHAI